jgi:hypothetical protein
MIEVAILNAGRIVCLRVVGVQSVIEFGTFSDSLPEIVAAAKPLRVIFDWTALDGWSDKTGSAASHQKWGLTAHLIERAAIVHDRRWYRQAAVLAAVLRTRNVQVRSWRVSELSRALVWLANDNELALERRSS